MPEANSGDFLAMLSVFAKQILPVVGVVILCILGKFLLELINIVKGLDKTVDKLNHTIENVDRSVDKLQAPLDTMESISYTVDDVHAFTKNSFAKSVSMITDNVEFLKDWANSLFSKDKKEEDQEPLSPKED